MSDVAIRVEGLGKRYKIGQRVGYHRFTEALAALFTAPFRKPEKSEGDGHFWALKDVSFEVKKGEVLGIIGRNGAGKSTLLKILSRVTDMTEGAVDVYGRIGSLLEVGTGFHPELTGRENIYLNGAILGMKRPEIRRKFDEIVDFSEIEKFLDTPVKHYSSGMYMRLAFAVAAHLEPDILVVDEVLAVGDAQFQKKCLGKMNEVAKGGRTILFVSHNIAAIKNLCQNCIWLSDGHVHMAGITGSVLSSYLSFGDGAGSSVNLETENRRAGLSKVITAVGLYDQHGRSTSSFQFDEPFCVVIQYCLAESMPFHRVCLHLHTQEGIELLVSTSEDSGVVALPERSGKYAASIKIPSNVLGPGTYVIGCSIDQPGVRILDDCPRALQFSVVGNPLPRGRRWEGILYLSPSWQIEGI